MQREHWDAIVACDSAYDHLFYYGVKTTKIFCRPSCKSRTPKRENVAIYRSRDEALGEGFRPCKRCRPDLGDRYAPEEELAERLAGLIEGAYQEDLTLEEMAQRLYASPYHLQRVFRRVRGISPTKHLAQVRVREAQKRLAGTDDPITEIALGVGFRTPAHFSEVFRKAVQCTPSEYREVARMGKQSYT